MSQTDEVYVERSNIVEIQDLDTNKNSSLSEKELLKPFDSTGDGDVSEKEFNSFQVSQNGLSRSDHVRLRFFTSGSQSTILCFQ